MWFAPGPATPDLLALFQDASQWKAARERIAVFKFYQSQLLSPPPQTVEGNTYTALRDVQAFRKLTTTWKKATAIEVGAVKAQYCTAEGSGEAQAVTDSVAAIDAVEAAGGYVASLAMDEPFHAAATVPACGAPNADAAADRVVAYIRGVQRSYPSIAIGLIEPYPYFPATTIARFLTTLRGAGITMPFFHVDVDLAQMKRGRDDFARDMRYLAGVCASHGTRFGMILWGESGDSNEAYMTGAWRRVQMTADAFADWPDMPQDLVFQSWAQEAETGRFRIPTNLPETTNDTHTNLIDRATPLLHGPEHARPPR